MPEPYPLAAPPEQAPGGAAPGRRDAARVEPLGPLQTRPGASPVGADEQQAAAAEPESVPGEADAATLPRQLADPPGVRVVVAQREDVRAARTDADDGHAAAVGCERRDVERRTPTRPAAAAVIGHEELARRLPLAREPEAGVRQRVRVAGVGDDR